MNKWSFDFLPPTIWSWNFSLNPIISSLESVKMFWWEREGCRVRRGEEGSKKKEKGIEKEEKELLDFRCSQENKKRRRLLGSKSDKGCWQLGWATCITREKYYTHLFQFSYIHTYIYIYIYIFFAFTLTTQNNITLHTHIYPYLYKIKSITLKEHIGSIISQKSKFHAQK